MLRAHLDALRSSTVGDLEVIALVPACAPIVDGGGIEVVRVPRIPSFLRVPVEQILVPAYARIRRADVIYCIGNVGLLVARMPVVILLQSPHHFRSLRPPRQRELYARGRRLRYWAERALARHTARRASAVIGVSETIAEAARREWRLSPTDVTVLKSSVFLEEPVGVDTSVMPPFCLFVANDYAHKQWARIAALFESFGKIPPLMVVGTPAKPDETPPSSIEEWPMLLRRRRVVFTGPISDRRVLSSLYHSAAAVLVHSLSETCGLTLLEARLAMCRIAASDLPAHRENGEGPGLQFYRPESEDDLLRALRDALEGERSTPPTGKGVSRLESGLVEVLTTAWLGSR